MPGLSDVRRTELVKEALAAYARRDDGGYGLENVKQLTGLVYGCTELPSEGHLKLYQRPIFWAVAVALVFAVLNILFW